MEGFRSLGDTIRDHARRRPNARAFVHEGRSLSWAEWDRRLNRVANGLLSLGLTRSDKVAIVSGNSIEAAEAFFGAIRGGFCSVPLSGMAAPQTLQIMIEDCDAKALLVSSDTYERIASFDQQLGTLVQGGRIGFDFRGNGWNDYQEWLTGASEIAAKVEVKPEDDFNIIYSSGTTGVPKGILHSHAFRFAMTERADRWGFGPHAINLVSTPLYSNTTMAALLPTLAFGGTNVLMSKFDERRFLELSQSEAVTHAIMVPVQYQRLLSFSEFGKYDLSSYLVKLCTGAVLHTETKRAVVRCWPGRLIEIYGLTEGGGVCLLDATAHPDKLHTVGVPSPLSDIRVIDEQGKELPIGEIGEVVGRQRIMMTGYYKKPEATEAIMWLDADGNRYQRTGDMGRFDEDGFLQLFDRKKDVIISGGFNIFAVDLEAVLLQHEGVDDAVVIGVPSERWGETPLGLVVVKAGHSIGAEELRTWANERLGDNQRLSAIEFRHSLPRTAIGKVLKRELRAPYWKGADPFRHLSRG